MATQTPNYNLIKPDPNTDYYNIEVHNDNADIIDAALSPIADPDQVPSGLTGKIAQWVSWITNRIKAITGKTNWYDNPATTLEAAKAHADANAPHAGHETPDGAQAKANAAVTAHKNEADPHPAYALDTELDTLEGTVNSHLAENAVLTPKSGSTANAILLDITLTDKKKGSFRAAANNTGNMTINSKAYKKDASTQIPADGIKAGKVYDFYYDEATDSVFILAKATGNAAPSAVLAPYTFSNDDGEQVGEIPSKAAATITPSSEQQIIEAGQYLSGAQTIEAITMSAGNNISTILAGGNVGNSGGPIRATTLKIRTNMGGSIRLKFTLAPNNTGYTVTARIYKNDVAIGTTRTVTSVLTFTEDFSCSADDIFTIYAVGSNTMVIITNYIASTAELPYISAV